MTPTGRIRELRLTNEEIGGGWKRTALGRIVADAQFTKLMEGLIEWAEAELAEHMAGPLSEFPDFNGGCDAGTQTTWDTVIGMLRRTLKETARVEPSG